MKGLELPINMIIILAIAVLVLVVIAAFFTGYFEEIPQYKEEWECVERNNVTRMGCPGPECNGVCLTNMVAQDFEECTKWQKVRILKEP